MEGLVTPCRFCRTPLKHVFADLGVSPLSNSFIPMQEANRKELFYPLKALVCEKCLLVQLDQFESPEHIFSEYLYFSSFSTSWLQHAERYVDRAVERFSLGPQSLVVEVASNDGYLLKNFHKHKVPVYGVEPAANVAEVAESKDVPTLVRFFGIDTAKHLVNSGKQADLMIGNNVMAHVPDLNDFIAGFKLTLKPRGSITIEAPHLLRLIQHNQFDTIYHEHFSYFSMLTAQRVFQAHGLELYDVEELDTHGGSVRMYVKHADNDSLAVSASVNRIIDEEKSFGLDDISVYLRFGNSIQKAKRELLKFLIKAKEEGKRVAGYGAPAKGNTLLNYCGVGVDLLEFTVDLSPYKQNHVLPGTRIPVYHPDKLAEVKPDYILILPWNIKDELVKQLQYTKEWGARLVLPIPSVEFVD